MSQGCVGPEQAFLECLKCGEMVGTRQERRETPWAAHVPEVGVWARGL